MSAILRSSPKLLAAVLAAAALVLPLASQAQELPPYAVAPAQDQQIHGRIESIDGTFNLTVRDDGGYLDAIQMRQGTIINPTGLTLSPGMVVTILGYPSGNVFNANEIDTPYTYSGPAPTPVYYGAGWWYPGYAYGYGPSFSLGIVIGFGGGYSCYRQPWAGHWWGGNPSWYHGGSYAYNNSGHGYTATVTTATATTETARTTDTADRAGSNGQGHEGQPGNGEHVTPTEPHGTNGTYGYARPVPVTGSNAAYHVPSSGSGYQPARAGGYGTYGGYAAPSNAGGYRTPGNAGGYRAPSNCGGGYHAASGGGGASRGGGGGGPTAAAGRKPPLRSRSPEKADGPGVIRARFAERAVGARTFRRPRLRRVLPWPAKARRSRTASKASPSGGKSFRSGSSRWISAWSD